MATTIYHCSNCKYVFSSLEEVTTGHICQTFPPEEEIQIVEAREDVFQPPPPPNGSIPLTIVQNAEQPINKSSVGWSKEDTELLLDAYQKEICVPFEERKPTVEIWKMVAAQLPHYTVKQIQSRYRVLSSGYSVVQQEAAKGHTMYYEWAERMAELRQAEDESTSYMIHMPPGGEGTASQEEGALVVQEQTNAADGPGQPPEDGEETQYELVTGDDGLATLWSTPQTNTLLVNYERVQMNLASGQVMTQDLWQQAAGASGYTWQQCKNRFKSLSLTYNKVKMAAAKGETIEFQYEKQLDKLFSAVLRKDRREYVQKTPKRYRNNGKNPPYEPSKSWTIPDTRRLIDLYQEHLLKASDLGSSARSRIWETISRYMPYNPEQCRGRMKTITNIYNKNRNSTEVQKTPYEDKLDVVFENDPRMIVDRSDIKKESVAASSKVKVKWSDVDVMELIKSCESQYKKHEVKQMQDATIWDKISHDLLFTSGECQEKFDSMVVEYRQEAKRANRGRKKKVAYADQLLKMDDLWPGPKTKKLYVPDWKEDDSIEEGTTTNETEMTISEDVPDQNDELEINDDLYIPDEEQSDVSEPSPKRKRKEPPALKTLLNKSVCSGKEKSEILDYLKDMEKRQEKRHNEQKERLEKMHKEKMTVLNQLTKMLSDNKETKDTPAKKKSKKKKK